MNTFLSKEKSPPAPVAAVSPILLGERAAAGREVGNQFRAQLAGAP